MPPRKRNPLANYRKKVVDILAEYPHGQHILDIPAGDAHVTDALREAGHRVTSADINGRREDYVYADMSKRLPFDDDTFDGVVCLEGIEHMLEPLSLFGELMRVVKIGGYVVISTPNITNMYSRLQFLLTGTFFQFNPAQLQDIGPDEVRDRFHISPMSYQALRYLGDYWGARVVKVSGDKVKRRVLFPIYLPIILLGKLWSYRLFFSRRYRAYRDRNQQIYRHINSWPVLFGRSIILVFEKTRSTASTDRDGITNTRLTNDVPLRRGAA